MQIGLGGLLKQLYRRSAEPFSAGGLMRALAGPSVGRILGTAVNFVLAVILSRTLDKSEVGMFYFSVTIVFGLSIIARMGLGDISLITFGGIRDSRRQSAIGPTLLLFCCYILVATFFIVFIFITLMHGDEAAKEEVVSRVSPLLIVAGLPSIALLQISGAALRGVGRPTLSSYTEFSAAPIFTLVVALSQKLVMGAATFDFAVAAYLVGSLLSGLLNLAVFFSIYPARRPLRVFLSKKYRLRGITFFSIEISSYIAGWSSFLLMPIFLGMNSLAIYNSVVRLSSLSSIIFSGIATVALPVLAKYQYQGNTGAFIKTINELQVLMLIFGSGLFLLFLIFGRNLLALFGSDFISAYPALLILGLSVFANLALGPASLILSVLKYEKIVLFVTVLSALASIVFTSALTPMYGINGAAAATLLATVLQKGVLAMSARKALERERVRHANQIERT